MLTNFENSIASPDLKKVASHWLTACAGRRMPAWNDIKPSDIRAQLPIVWAYIYDRENDTFTGRLAGESVVSLFGKNFHGLPMSEASPKNDFSRLFSICKKVIEECALYHGAGIIFRLGNCSGQGERIIMPLSGDGLHGDGILGATVSPRFDLPGVPEISFDAESEDWFSPTVR